MSVVVDSSAVLAWVYRDETTGAIGEVFALVMERGAWVPALWRLEVANVLEMGVRRGRHDAAFRDATLADLARHNKLLAKTSEAERSALYTQTGGKLIRLPLKAQAISIENVTPQIPDSPRK